jgi:alpha-ribazole phosphatase
LLRAQQTAAEIAHIVRRPVIIDPRLNEMHFGIFEGLTFEEIAKKYPDMWEQREKNKLKYTGHKGESLIEFRDRVMGSLERIFYQFPDGDIAVVSHGGTNRVIMCALLGLDMKGFHLLRQDNTCINVLDIKVGKKKHIPCVWSINDISHLDTRFPKKKNVWH